jgi:transcriptional regulator with XRE-family HTH domain
MSRGLSARALAVQAGLSASVVGKIEAETMRPTVPVFAAIVHRLQLTDREIALLVRCSMLKEWPLQPEVEEEPQVPGGGDLAIDASHEIASGEG